MPKFRVDISREHTEVEVATVRVEAKDAAEAVAMVRRMVAEDEESGDMDVEWCEEDGWTDPRSYTWKTTEPSGAKYDLRREPAPMARPIYNGVYETE